MIVPANRMPTPRNPLPGYALPKSECPICHAPLIDGFEREDLITDLRRHYYWHKLEELSNKGSEE